LAELKKFKELFSGAFDAKITAVVDVDDFHCIVSAEKPVLDRIQQMLKEEIRKFDVMRNPIPGILCSHLSYLISHYSFESTLFVTTFCYGVHRYRMCRSKGSVVGRMDAWSCAQNPP
jgi:hypothetical protein